MSNQPNTERLVYGALYAGDPSRPSLKEFRLKHGITVPLKLLSAWAKADQWTSRRDEAWDQWARFLDLKLVLRVEQDLQELAQFQTSLAQLLGIQDGGEDVQKLTPTNFERVAALYLKLVEMKFKLIEPMLQERRAVARPEVQEDESLVVEFQLVDGGLSEDEIKEAREDLLST